MLVKGAPVVCSVPSHYENQCLFIDFWEHISVNFNQNTAIYIQKTTLIYCQQNCCHFLLASMCTITYGWVSTKINKIAQLPPRSWNSVHYFIIILLTYHCLFNNLSSLLWVITLHAGSSYIWRPEGSQQPGVLLLALDSLGSGNWRTV